MQPLFQAFASRERCARRNALSRRVRERRVHPRILRLRLLGYGAIEMAHEEARHDQNNSNAPHPALRHAEQAIRFHVMGDARAGDHRDPEPYRHEPNGHHDERGARSVGPGHETDPSVEEVGLAFELLFQPDGFIPLVGMVAHHRLHGNPRRSGAAPHWRGVGCWVTAVVMVPEAQDML